MAVSFDVDAWREKYPVLSEKYTDAQLEQFFLIASTLLLDNTDKSIVKDEEERSLLYDMLVCHLATLADRGTDVVGSMTSASEGSVSAGFSPPTSSDDWAAWYNQTQCGMMYWICMRKYRYGGIYCVYRRH